MSIEIEKLTDRDIRKFKREIEGYEKSKRIFFILGFVFLGLCVFLLIVAALFGVLAALQITHDGEYVNYMYFTAFLTLAITSASFASTFFLVMLIMFILRGVLFQKKTENRLAAIEDYEEYKKSQQIDAKRPIDNNDPVEVAGEVAD